MVLAAARLTSAHELSSDRIATCSHLQPLAATCPSSHLQLQEATCNHLPPLAQAATCSHLQPLAATCSHLPRSHKQPLAPQPQAATSSHLRPRWLNVRDKVLLHRNQYHTSIQDAWGFMTKSCWETSGLPRVCKYYCFCFRSCCCFSLHSFFRATWGWHEAG